MPSLAQTLRRKHDAGQRLPKALDSLEELGVVLRRGHVALLAAAPGGYKSVLALHFTLRMAVPSLYLAMDSDEHATAIRTVQMAWSLQSEDAESEVASNGNLARQVADSLTWARFDFPSSPDVEEIAQRVWAYAEMEGEFPHFIVIDNLMDMEFEGASPHEGYERAMVQLTNLAKAAKAAVLVLSHVTGEYESDPKKPIPLGGLMYKTGKKPALVLTMCEGPEPSQMMISVVKNRNGDADKSGFRVRAKLRVNGAQMQIE